MKAIKYTSACCLFLGSMFSSVIEDASAATEVPVPYSVAGVDFNEKPYGWVGRVAGSSGLSAFPVSANVCVSAAHGFLKYNTSNSVWEWESDVDYTPQYNGQSSGMEKIPMAVLVWSGYSRAEQEFFPDGPPLNASTTNAYITSRDFASLVFYGENGHGGDLPSIDYGESLNLLLGTNAVGTPLWKVFTGYPSDQYYARDAQGNITGTNDPNGYIGLPHVVPKKSYGASQSTFDGLLVDVIKMTGVRTYGGNSGGPVFVHQGDEWHLCGILNTTTSTTVGIKPLSAEVNDLVDLGEKLRLAALVPSLIGFKLIKPEPEDFTDDGYQQIFAGLVLSGNENYSKPYNWGQGGDDALNIGPFDLLLEFKDSDFPQESEGVVNGERIYPTYKFSPGISVRARWYTPDAIDDVGSEYVRNGNITWIESCADVTGWMDVENDIALVGHGNPLQCLVGEVQEFKCSFAALFHEGADSVSLMTRKANTSTFSEHAMSTYSDDYYAWNQYIKWLVMPSAGLWQYYFEAKMGGLTVRYPETGTLQIKIEEPPLVDLDYDIAVEAKGGSSRVNPGSNASVRYAWRNPGVESTSGEISWALYRPDGTFDSSWKPAAVLTGVIAPNFISPNQDISVPIGNQIGTWKVVARITREGGEATYDNNIAEWGIYAGNAQDVDGYKFNVKNEEYSELPIIYDLGGGYTIKVLRISNLGNGKIEIEWVRKNGIPIKGSHTVDVGDFRTYDNDNVSFFYSSFSTFGGNFMEYWVGAADFSIKAEPGKQTVRQGETAQFLVSGNEDINDVEALDSGVGLTMRSRGQSSNFSASPFDKELYKINTTTLAAGDYTWFGVVEGDNYSYFQRFELTVLPKLPSLTPPAVSGPSMTVIITGANLGSNGTLFVDGVPTATSGWTDSAITFVSPQSSGVYSIYVVNSAGASNSAIITVDSSPKFALQTVVGGSATPTYNFGVVEVGQSSVAKVFRLANTGNDTLLIGNFWAPSEIGYSLMDPSGAPVQTQAVVEAGEYVSLNLTYTPSDLGADAHTFSFDTSDSEHGEVSLSLSGSGKDTTAPGITVQNPAENSVATINPVASVYGSFSDFSPANLAYTVNGGSSTAITPVGNSWSIQNLNLVEGNNLVVVTATDTSGNAASDSVTFVYTIPYTLTLLKNIEEGGVVSGGGNYLPGSQVTAGALANEGYNFIEWQEGGVQVSTVESYPFNLAGSRTLTAIFDTVEMDGILTSVSAVNVAEGSSGTFQVKLSKAPSVTTVVTVTRTSGDDDVTVTGGASLTFTTSNWNTYQTVTLAAAQDADTTNGTATLTCSATGLASVTVTATEVDNDTTLTVVAGTGGTVVPSGDVVVTKDVAKSISATPSAGYTFVNWTVTSGSATLGNPSLPTTTATISGPATVMANFVGDPNPTASLLITQYYEGSSFNKYLEICNVGDEPVDLSGFFVTKWANAACENWKVVGNVPSSSVQLTGSLAPGACYVISHASAASPLAAGDAQMTNAVADFNGNDSVVLYSGNVFDPDHIVDAISLTYSGNEGADTSFVRISEAAGYDLDAGTSIVTYPGVWEEVQTSVVDSAPSGTDNHLGSSRLGDPAATISFVVGSQSASEGGGGVPLEVVIENPDGQQVSVDVVFDAGSSTASASDISGFTRQTVTFPATAKSGDVMTVNISINDDSNAEGPESAIFVLEGLVSSGGAAIGGPSSSSITIQDNDTSISRILIAEIADPADNPNARFLELYNAGSSDIDLGAGAWHLVVYFNGSSVGTNIPLSGVIPAQAFYVVATNLGNFATAYPGAAVPDMISGNLNSNGDEAFELRMGGDAVSGTLVDVYGVPGIDGTGEVWDFVDSRVTRNVSVLDPRQVYLESEWTVATAATVSDMTPGSSGTTADEFDLWIGKYPSIPVNKRGRMDDADGDGTPNAVEMFFDSSPERGSERGGLFGAVYSNELPAGRKLVVRFHRNKTVDPAVGVVRWSSDLSAWSANGQTTGGVRVNLSDPVVKSSGSGYDVMEVTATVASGAPKSLYLRIEIDTDAL